MTKTKKRVATVSELPIAETIIPPELIRDSARAREIGFVAIGHTDRIQKQHEVDERSIAYVEMNKSGRITVEPGCDGVVATSSLAGCTGVSGYSRQKDGSIKSFVSHYDAMTQNYAFTHNDSPANGDLWTFKHETLTADPDGDTLIVIAYPRSVEREPNRGTRKGSHKEWHYLDQLETTAEYLDEGTEVLMLPYDMNSGHTLASGRINGEEGIFWDGMPIDFEAALTEHDIIPQANT